MNKLSRGIFVAALTFVSGAFAATSTWTGAAGDGRWSSPSNWENACVPTNGTDDVVFPASSFGATVQDLAPSLTVGSLMCNNTSGRLYFKGGEIRFRNSKAPGSTFDERIVLNLDASVGVDFDCDLAFSAKRQVIGVTTFLAQNGTVNFNGAVNAGEYPLILEAASGMRNTYLYFNGKVTAGEMLMNFGYKHAHLVFSGTGHQVGKIESSYASATWLSARNCLGGKTVLGFNHYQKGAGYDRYNIDADQTIDCISSDTVVGLASGDQMDILGHGGEEPAEPYVLTLRATTSAETWARIDGNIALDYNPTESTCVQTFHDRIHPTKGRIFVRGGTLRVAGANQFTSVPRITVADSATFDVSTSAGVTAFPAVTRLDLGANSRFAVSAESSTPFGATTAVRVFARSSSRFAIPSGSVLTVGSVLVDGVPLAARSYTGTAGLVDGGGTLCVLSAPSATCWTGAAGDLDWNKAGNWSDGVPTATKDVVIATAGDKIIQVKGNFRSLDAQNGSGVTTLAFDSAFSTVGGRWELGTGVVAKVGSSGDFTFDGTDSSSVDGSIFSLVDGGVFKVEGGIAFFTNITANVSVGGVTGSGGELRMTSGRLDVRRGSAGTGRLALGAGAIIACSGGEFWIDHHMAQKGGVFSFSGDSTLKLDYYDEDARLFSGVRSVAFSDSASLVWVRQVGVYPKYNFAPAKDADATNEVVVSGSASIQADYWDILTVGNGTTEYLPGAVRLAYRSSAVSALSHSLSIGRTTGVGIFELEGGRVKVTGYRLSVGEVPYGVGSYTCYPWGLLRVSNGSLYLSAEASTSEIRGFLVGNGQYSGEYANSHYPDGVVELSGGAITSMLWTAFGLSVGSGKMLQTGGDYRASSSNGGLILGFRGGMGEYALSGGRFSTAGAVYVGGCPTNVLEVYSRRFRAGYPGYGSLKVAGGDFYADKDLYVSAEGYGLLEIGAAGSISVNNVYLTNSVDGVKSQVATSELKFVLGADGCGTLNVRGNFVAAADARLVVDASAYEGKNRIHLIKTDLNRIIRPFAEDKITVVPANDKYSVRLGSDGYWLTENHGLCIIVR